MADTLITNLANVASPTGAEELPVNVPGSPDTDGKVVLSALAAYVEGTLGNAAGLDVGTTAGTVAAGDDSRFADARTPTAHAASHTNGTDDIQNATASVKGLATAAQITKLDGIEALADVTDATNVASAGALMTSSLGTGIATALGVNVGSAGAPVVNGGALGTPSGGVLTNCSGLPTAGLVDDAVTLAKMAAGTAGNLITYDASGNPAAVATGTAGQVLTSNGAGAAPTMQTPSGGGGDMVFLGTTTVTAAAALTVDNVFDDAVYDHYIISGSLLPATDSVSLMFDLRTAVPADVGVTAYGMTAYGRVDGGTAQGTVSNQTVMAVNIGNAAGEGAYLDHCVLRMPSGEYSSFFLDWRVVQFNGVRYAYRGAFEIQDTTPRQGIKLSFSSGNVASGTLRIWGVKK